MIARATKIIPQERPILQPVATEPLVAVGSGIVFDAEKHTYHRDGERLPSVTQILTDAGLIDKTFFTDRGRDKGVAIHACIQLDIVKKLDPDSVDPEVLPYLEQWRDFLADTRFEVLASEKLVWSNAYGYAGCLDIYGRLHGRYMVIDFKSNHMPKWVDCQTAAYGMAMRERGYVVHELACLVLKPKTYRLSCFERTVAEAEWMSVLKGVAA